MDDVHVSWWLGQAASLGTLILSSSGVIPFLVAIVPLVYYGLMIYDHPRVRQWRFSRRQRKIVTLTVEIARLKARQVVEDAQREQVIVAAHQVANIEHEVRNRIDDVTSSPKN